MTDFVELRKKTSLFSTGLIQVFFVSMNTYFLSFSLELAVFITSFMISLIWTFNVKRVVFGKIWDQVVYALGAAAGSVVGLLTAETLYSWATNP